MMIVMNIYLSKMLLDFILVDSKNKHYLEIFFKKYVYAVNKQTLVNPMMKLVINPMINSVMNPVINPMMNLVMNQFNDKF